MTHDDNDDDKGGVSSGSSGGLFAETTAAAAATEVEAAIAAIQGTKDQHMSLRGRSMYSSSSYMHGRLGAGCVAARVETWLMVNRSSSSESKATKG